MDIYKLTLEQHPGWPCNHNHTIGLTGLPSPSWLCSKNPSPAQHSHQPVRPSPHAMPLACRPCGSIRQACRSQLAQAMDGSVRATRLPGCPRLGPTPNPVSLCFSCTWSTAAQPAPFLSGGDRAGTNCAVIIVCHARRADGPLQSNYCLNHRDDSQSACFLFMPSTLDPPVTFPGSQGIWHAIRIVGFQPTSHQ